MASRTKRIFIKDRLIEFCNKLGHDNKPVRDIYNSYVHYELDKYNTPKEEIIWLRKFMKELRNVMGYTIKRRWVNSLQEKEFFITDWGQNI